MLKINRTSLANMRLVDNVALIILVALTIFAFSPNPAIAANESLTFNGFFSVGCDANIGNPTPGQTALNLTITLDAATYFFDTIVEAGGDIYTDWFFGGPFAGGTGSAVWGLTNRNDRGLQTASYPLPVDTPITVTVILRDANQQAIWQLIVVYVCNTGTVLSVQSEGVGVLGSHLITVQIPEEPVTVVGESFFATELTINYQSGDMILSRNADGTGNIVVDDAIELTVIRPDGSVDVFIHSFVTGVCFGISSLPPQDLTSLFQPGENRVLVRLFDVCGVKKSSSSLYLVNIGEPPKAPIIEYFALGDSIASGHGLMDTGLRCRRSIRAYPHIVKQLLETRYEDVNLHDELACSGAAVLDGDGAKLFHNQVVAALEQIAEVPSERPILVSITVGANDFHWSEPLNFFRQLIRPESSFQRWVNDTSTNVTTSVRADVEQLLSYENVSIVITQYHNPINRESRFFVVMPGRNCTDILDNINECYERTEFATHQLNNALEENIVAPIGGSHRLTVTPNLHDDFHGHESPGVPNASCGFAAPAVGDTWIQFLGDQTSNSFLPRPLRLDLDVPGDCFHPNILGARAYAEAVFNAALTLGL